MTAPVMTTDHSVCQCVDLRATLGKRFRYTMDPAYAIERSEFRTIERPWLTRIACRFGFIGVQGGRRLTAYSITRRRALAELLQARRPRQLSPEARAAAAARLQAFRTAKTAAMGADFRT